MAHRLMKQYAGCASPHDHAHLASLRPYGFKPCVDASYYIFGQFLRKRPAYELCAHAETPGSGLVFCLSILLEHCGHTHAAHRACVMRQFSQRIVHQHITYGI